MVISIVDRIRHSFLNRVGKDLILGFQDTIDTADFVVEGILQQLVKNDGRGSKAHNLLIKKKTKGKGRFFVEKYKYLLEEQVFASRPLLINQRTLVALLTG